MRLPKIFIPLLFMTLAAAGCTPTISVPKVAQPLGPPDIQGATSQHGGFGELPKISFPSVQAEGAVNIKTDLPSLQSTATVVRLPNGSLNLTEFQNLTQAIGLPAGLIGDDTNNLGYTITWTNSEGLVWQYFSNEHKLSFTNPKAKSLSRSSPNWMGKDRLITQVDVFLKQHGVDERVLRNIQIVPAWDAWLAKADQLRGCLPSEVRNQVISINPWDKMFEQAPPTLPNAQTTGCVTDAYPSVIPVTFERLVDGWNILDKDGNPELGGEMLINASTGEMVFGWMILPSEPQRSDYQTISTDEMRGLLENGGLAGPLPGFKEINAVSFAFVRLPKTQDYSYDYLVPAIVAETSRSTDKGPQTYRIVVPLIKQ